MSCRHDLANGTCTTCYPDNPFRRADIDRIDPGPESGYGENMDGPDAVPLDIYRDPPELDGMAPGERLETAIGEHHFAITATAESGLHTGRTKFSVECTTCASMLHKSTTGPWSRVIDHARGGA